MRGIVTITVTALLAGGISTASAEVWTGHRSGPDRNPTSAVFPGADLSTVWTGSAKNGSLSNQSWNRACVLVDEDRVYAVHKDVEDTSLARLVVMSRSTGVGVWTSEAYGSSPVDCPVLVDGMIVVPTGYSPSLQQSPGLRAFDAATGNQVWSTPFTGGGSVSGALASDGTRVYGSGAGLIGCPFDSYAAWNLATGARAWCVPGSQTEAAPLVIDGVIIQGKRSERGLVALDPSNGSTLWSDAEALNLFDLAGQGGQVAYTARDNQLDSWVVRLVDAATGAKAWQVPLPSSEAPGAVILDGTRAYAVSGLMNGGNLRLRAIDRATGSLAWGPVAGDPAWSEHLYLLGDRVVAGSVTADRTTGATSTGYNWAALPQNPSFADGTIFGWAQRADSTWSVRAVRDTTKPTLGTLAPADGMLTTDGTPTFSFAPGDGAGTGVATATLVLDGTRHNVTGTTSSTPAAALADGPHSWALEAVDAAGNVTTSASRTLTVDTTAPAPFEVTAPEADGTVVTGTPEIAWTPSSDVTSGIDHYDVFLDGTRVQVVPPCAVDCTANLGAPMADGAYELELVAVDAAGLTRSSGIVPFTIAEPPVAALEASSGPYAFAGDGVQFDARGSTDNGGTLTYAWDLDGDGVFDDGAGRTTNAVLKGVRVHTVSVRVSDGTLTDTAQVQVDARAMPPAGEVGISINNGAYATNDPNVRVSLVWRNYDLTALLSNDGGFGPAGNAEEFAVAPSLDWALATEGRERLPKTVWVRLKGKPGAEDRDLTDDIILDTTDPVVDSASFVTSARTSLLARLAAVRIRFSATDNAAGIRGVNVTTDKSRPGTLIKVTRNRSVDSVVKATVGAGPVYIRALDAARNPSAWRRVR